MCYTNVRVSIPDGKCICVEGTDAGLVDALRTRVGPGAAGCRIEYRVLHGRNGPGDPVVIAISSAVDVRRDPSHASELRTQIIYGDEVDVLRDDGDWMLVRIDDGYVGWVRTWHLATIPRDALDGWRAAARHRVDTNCAEVFCEPTGSSLPVTDLVMGTQLISRPCARRGWRAVRLADGRQGFVMSRALRGARRTGPIRERLSSTGLRFLGIPYIWGGTTPKGFDCSGLIQRIFRLEGRALPRDADMQSRFGVRIDGGRPDDVATGDLLFFGREEDHITHVAMALSDGLFLHAYGQVRVGSIDPSHRLYEPRLHHIWRFARDVLSPDDAAGL